MSFKIYKLFTFPLFYTPPASACGDLEQRKVHNQWRGTVNLWDVYRSRRLSKSQMLCERISRLQNSQSNSKRQDNHNIKARAFSPSAVPELCNYCNTSVLRRLQNGAKSRTFLLFTERQFYNRRQQQQDAAWTIGKLFISVQIYYTNRFYI